MQTPSTTTKASAHACTALVSREVAKLLHKLQGQIIKEASAPREAGSGEVVLAPPNYTTHRFIDGSIALALNLNSPCGARLHLQTNYHGDTNNPYRPLPGIWYGSETRVGHNGEHWKRDLPHHVVDNFGDLVEVPA